MPKKQIAGLYAVLLVAVVAVMFMLKTCTSQRHFHGETKLHPGGDTLVVAIEYAPLAMYSSGDSLSGFGYEMMTRIADDNGLKIKYVPIVSFSSALTDMSRGRFDIIIAEIPLTAEFKQRYRFTSPVYLDRQILVQHRDSLGNTEVKTQLDLAGKRLRVIAGSPVADRIASLAREIGDTIIIDPDTIYSSEQLFLLVASGEIPFAVVNASTARKLAEHRNDVDIARGISFTQFQSWIVNSSKQSIADSIDSAIVRFRHTPDYMELTERYGVTPVSE